MPSEPSLAGANFLLPERRQIFSVQKSIGLSKLGDLLINTMVQTMSGWPLGFRGLLPPGELMKSTGGMQLPLQEAGLKHRASASSPPVEVQPGIIVRSTSINN